jgi:hypothetical protein
MIIILICLFSNVAYTVASQNKLTVDGAEAHLVNIILTCDRNLTPWCNCTGQYQKDYYDNFKRIMSRALDSCVSVF